MDIYCPICGEPLDTYELHEIEGMTYAEARKAFYREGCTGVGFTHNANTTASPEIGVLYELLGDDVDGAAAMLEDLEYMGFGLYE